MTGLGLSAAEAPPVRQQSTLDGSVPIPAPLRDLPVAKRLAEVDYTRERILVRAQTGSGKTVVFAPYEILAAKMAGKKVKAAVRVPTKAVSGFLVPALKSLWGPLGLKVAELNRDVTEAAAAEAVKADFIVISDGTLPRLLKMAPDLTHYFADEIHSISLGAELDLSLAKIHKLKLRLMSATVDPSNLLDYLGPETLDLVLEGRSFPIEKKTIWASDKVFDRQDERELMSILYRFCETWKETGKAGIVFLATRALCDTSAAGLAHLLPTKAIHGGVNPMEAEKWAAEHSGQSFAVFATVAVAVGITLNVDEVLMADEKIESETVRGIEETTTSCLDDNLATQMLGRCGRLRPGTGYLLTNDKLRNQAYGDPWDNIQPRPIKAPSEKATPFEVVLQLSIHGIYRDEDIDLLGKPNPGELAHARQWLERNGCLEADGSPTRLGRRISAFPMPTQMSHAVLTAPTVQSQLAILAAFTLGAGGPYQLVKEKPLKRNDGRVRPPGFNILPPESLVAESVPLSLAKLLAMAFEVDKDNLYAWCNQRNLLAKPFFAARKDFMERGGQIVKDFAKQTLISTDFAAIANDVHWHLSRHPLFKRGQFDGDTRSGYAGPPAFLDSCFSEAMKWRESLDRRIFYYIPQKKTIRNFQFTSANFCFAEPMQGDQQ
jgi:HrpA-like RNA helicase